MAVHIFEFFTISVEETWPMQWTSCMIWCKVIRMTRSKITKRHFQSLMVRVKLVKSVVLNDRDIPYDIGKSTRSAVDGRGRDYLWLW